MALNLDNRLYPRYIKKVEVKTVLKKQQQLLALLFTSLLILLAIVQLLVFPKVISIYLRRDLLLLAQDLLYYSQVYAITSIVLGAVIGSYLLLLAPRLYGLKKILKKYKQHELVLTAEVIDFKAILIMAIMVFFVAYIVVSAFLSLLPIIQA